MLCMCMRGEGVALGEVTVSTTEFLAGFPERDVRPTKNLSAANDEQLKTIRQ